MNSQKKSILIIEPSTSGLKLIKAAHHIGVNTIILTANQDERIIPDEYKKWIDQEVIVDTNNITDLLQVASRITEQNKVVAVLPGFEFYVEIAAQIGHYLNCPSLNPTTAAALRFKDKMRAVLESNHLNVPRYRRVENLASLKAAADYVGFPCVIKPIDSAGSVHVSKAECYTQLVACYEGMCTDPWTEMGKGIGSIAIVEAYIAGKEFSVEGYITQGKANIVAITEKFLGKEPYFVELGHIVPADLPQAVKEKLESYTARVIQALNIQVGAFHCEIRINNAGEPVLIEIAARLPGDKICDLIQLASGVDLYTAMIKSYLGKAKALIAPSSKIQRYAGIRFLTLNGQEIYQTIQGVEKLKRMPGFQSFEVILPPNQSVPPQTSFRGRVAYFILTAPHYLALLSSIERAAKMIIFS
jgi:biotin carboxylase